MTTPLTTQSAFRERLKAKRESILADQFPVTDTAITINNIPAMRVNLNPRLVNQGDAIFDLQRVIAERRVNAARLRQELDTINEEIRKLERAADLLVELQQMVAEAVT